MDNKDEIISIQLDLIRRMTEQNVKRLSDDIWGLSPKAAVPASASVDTGEKKKTLLTATASTSDLEQSAKGEDTSNPERIEDLLSELDSYIGLESVKSEVRSLVNMAKVYKLRRDNSLPVADMSLHMVFSGNPGTGKTMIARLMARVYHSIGLLSKGHLVEADRSALVAGFVGQTAVKTSDVLKRALGGVLFIDEAYSLTNGTENDFGLEAVDTVLKFMEDNRDDIVVIVAGYTDLMENFIDSNPGLRSRFNKYIEFDDYTSDEMTEIFELQCKKGEYVPEEDALSALREYFAAVLASSGEFGNARGVRNTFEKLLMAQANRLASYADITKDALMSLTAEDVEAALYANREE